MKKTSLGILAVNVGSSSIKFAFFNDVNSQGRVFEGALERIGQADSRFWMNGETAADNFSRAIKATNHIRASAIIIEWIEKRLGHDGLAAVGHRVVHGGPNYSEPRLINSKLIANLRKLASFDPEHLPIEIAAIEAFRRRWPGVPQVACFDTAFHRDLPRVAQILPIPRRYEARGVRRYGFHGLSCEFLMEELARTAGPRAANGKVILAHLGNGASLTAVDHGKSVDTSMGLTPAGGVPMGTRSGDLDPGLVLYLARIEGMSAKQFNTMVNFESGLQGISETGSDMEKLLKRATHDRRAAEAVAVFCYQIKKMIGAYAAALGRLDILVFTGGIGENAPVIRALVCDGLGFIGVKLARGKNEANNPVINADSGRVAVRVMHTDEEFMIARSTNRVLALGVKK
jgi:acetate kinase